MYRVVSAPFQKLNQMKYCCHLALEPGSLNRLSQALVAAAPVRAKLLLFVVPVPLCKEALCVR